MRITRGDRYRQKIHKNLAELHVGDKVQIVNCAEEDKYRTQVFEVLSEAWQVCGTWCVRISERGTWDIGCLEKVTT